MYENSSLNTAAIFLLTNTGNARDFANELTCELINRVDSISLTSGIDPLYEKSLDKHSMRSTVVCGVFTLAISDR